MNIIVIFFYLFLLAKTQVIIAPFKTMTPNKLTHENIISELINNNIFINLKIGNPSQKIPVLLKLNQIAFFIVSSSYNNDSKKYNSSKSSSYIQNPKEAPISNNYNFNQAFLGEDIISIESINKKDSFINRTQFFLATNLTKRNDALYGEIGLNIINLMYFSFVNQLKEKRLITDYIFSLRYTKENEGEFIIGNYLHTYNDNYKENDFIKIEAGVYDDYSYSYIWKIYLFTKVLSDKNYTYNNNVLLSYEFGFILGTMNYHSLIKQIFFDHFELQCEKKNFDDYFFYVCNDNIDLNTFPDIIFYRDDFNCNFTKKDLWKKYDNKYYFLIIFKENQKEWILGKIFFQKYTISFNLDQKIIGFYPNSANSIQTEEKKHEKKEFSFLWIFIIILFILLIVSIIFIIYLLKTRDRKMRANELGDCYDYTAQEDKKDPISINN